MPGLWPCLFGLSALRGVTKEAVFPSAAAGSLAVASGTPHDQAHQYGTIPGRADLVLARREGW